jgi:hypothetical protein
MAFPNFCPTSIHSHLVKSLVVDVLAPERQTAQEGGQQLGNYPLANEFAM